MPSLASSSACSSAGSSAASRPSPSPLPRPGRRRAAVRVTGAGSDARRARRLARWTRRRCRRSQNAVRQNAGDAASRVQLGNLYFDAERFQDAAKWYEEALKLRPKDVDVSTDLGVAYYSLNQPDRALAQFEYSLKVDPKHAKTLLNQGIVLAFGKQDLQGAAASWQKVIDVGAEQRGSRHGEAGAGGLKSAHPNLGSSPSGSTRRASRPDRCLSCSASSSSSSSPCWSPGRSGAWSPASSWARRCRRRGRDASRGGPPARGVQMVRDPVCGTFLPPDNALTLTARGGARYFCSETCRQRFRQQSLRPPMTSKPSVLLTRRIPSAVLGRLEAACDVDLARRRRPDSPRGIAARVARQAGAALPAHRQRGRRGAERRARTCGSSRTSRSATTTSTCASASCAGNRGHEHAGRSDRGDRRTHLGADPRRHAEDPRGRSAGSHGAPGRAGRSTSCSGWSCAGKQLGIVGSGADWRLPSPPAPRPSACRWRIARLAPARASSTSPLQLPEIVALPLDELLATSDVVSLHVPLTPRHGT